MSLSTLQSKEKTLLREISSLEKNAAHELKNISSAEKRISDAEQAIIKTKSNSTIRTKQTTIRTENSKLQRARKKHADLSSKLATKRASLGDTQVNLTLARIEEDKKVQQKMQQNYDNQIFELKNIQSKEHDLIASEILIDPQFENKEYDIFISYASEDTEYVDELGLALEKSDISIWRDKDSIVWGQSIRQSIDAGLSRSRFGIVILSSAYIRKYWTNYELSGILNKESSTGRQMILPIWHNVTKDEIDSKSPSLADRLALDSRLNSTTEIIEQLQSLLS